MLAVERNQLPHIDVGHAIAVGQHEGLVPHPGLKAFDPAAGLRLQPRIDEVERPIFTASIMYLQLPGAQPNREVTAKLMVIEEIVLDHFALVPQRHNKLGEPASGVDLHNVPEEWPAPDLDHRLGLDFRLLGQPGAEASS